MKKSVSGQNLSPDEQRTMAGAALGAPIQTEASVNEGRIDPVEAYEILDSLGLLGKDFFTLSNDEVNSLMTQAKRLGYKSDRKTAPGSSVRMFFQYLTRMADGVAKRRQSRGGSVAEGRGSRDVDYDDEGWGTRGKSKEQWMIRVDGRNFKVVSSSNIATKIYHDLVAKGHEVDVFPMHLEEDQVNELSKDTLKSYAKKARADYGVAKDQSASNFSSKMNKKAMDHSKQLNPVDRERSEREIDRLGNATKFWNNKADKRSKGLDRAIDRLANESKRTRRLSESEVQQAQVVLAAQDMVDQVQKMIEQVTAIQFKDLPALVNQVKNEIGHDQATQFNSDATTSLGTLVQSMQTSKQQLEQAVGVVTGQQSAMPMPQEDDFGGNDFSDDFSDDFAEPEVDIDTDIDMDFEEPSDQGLGRKRQK
jgi:hypothetical protein